MKRCVQSFVYVLLLNATIPFFVQAQQYYLGKFPYFYVDYACFKADSSKSYVEFYTQIAYADLQFVNKYSHYAAEYEVDISFYKQNTLIKNRHYVDSIKVQTFEETNANNNCRLSLLGEFLEPGEYQCKIMLTDNETKKEAGRILDVSIKSFDEQQVAISDLQFVQQVKMVQDAEGAFVKSGRLIKPNVTNSFGFFALKMYVYYEVYGLPHVQDISKDFAIVDYKIIDRAGKLRKTLQKKVDRGKENSAHSILLAINDLPPGQYAFEVEVKDPDRNISASQRKNFIIGWQETAENGNCFERLIEQIEIIATAVEARQLRQIYAERKRAVILAFWHSKDPSPGTLENELMQEFYRRIDYANRQFGNLKMEGWRTDRGRTYVRYGPPDSIQRLLSDLGRKASEIWYYSSPQNRFHFVENSSLEIFELMDKTLTMRHDMK